MMDLLIFFIGSVIIWMVISLIIVLAMYNRKSKDPEPSGQESYATDEETPKMLPEHGSAEELFSRYPDITDWLILDANGQIVTASSKTVAEPDNKFIQLVQWTRDKSIDLKLADVQIMELESEKRTIIISFPNALEIEYYLVLYRVPAERSALHEELRQLNWNDLRQLMERNETTYEENH